MPSDKSEGFPDTVSSRSVRKVSRVAIAVVDAMLDLSMANEVTAVPQVVEVMGVLRGSGLLPINTGDLGWVCFVVTQVVLENDRPHPAWVPRGSAVFSLAAVEALCRCCMISTDPCQLKTGLLKLERKARPGLIANTSNLLADCSDGSDPRQVYSLFNNMLERITCATNDVPVKRAAKQADGLAGRRWLAGARINCVPNMGLGSR
ncbi:hypothetical protein QBC44DRAFT_362449 [Cladorrhinum sp. PSN332]|nr:hypothetical protein QBC44DRAFT_362449 [Cladorrhinum sp. PSN332]